MRLEFRRSALPFIFPNFKQIELAVQLSTWAAHWIIAYHVKINAKNWEWIFNERHRNSRNGDISGLKTESCWSLAYQGPRSSLTCSAVLLMTVCVVLHGGSIERRSLIDCCSDSIMSSGRGLSFVSETDLEEKRKKRQEEWEKVRQPDEPLGMCARS